MNFFTLILRSLRFHARAHLGVILGSAVGSAALIGALVVGDSVRGSLHEMALQRLGKIHYALAPSDRFFRAELAKAFGGGPSIDRIDEASKRLDPAPATHALRLPAMGSAQNGAARANRVQAIGVADDFWKMGDGSQLAKLADDGVALNEAVAAQLNAGMGDTVLLRIRKPSALSQEAVISPKGESSVALRLRVQAIVPAAGLGDFSLAANQVAPLNAFLRFDVLAKAVGIPGRANLLLVESLPKSTSNVVSRLDSMLRDYLSPSDLELELRNLPGQGMVELRSSRIFLDAPVVRAIRLGSVKTAGDSSANSTNRTEVLTYFVNQLSAGERATPYSMVSAIGPPVVPADMRDDEILINQWLADDLQAGPGSDLALTYFLADSGARLVERKNHFRVRAVVPMVLPYADRTLMPDFPGIAKAESTLDWDAGFRLVHTIRGQDDKYWKQWRGTPKAFISLAAGQKTWANRFGDLTAVRFEIPANATPAGFRSAIERKVLSELNPDELGLRFEPVREQAEAAANQAQDFGQLFLGFSFFLILASLILMALLFQFGLEQRTSEVGTLLALGFTPKNVRRLLLAEGIMLALVGGIIGVLGGIAYARVMLVGLKTIWRGAVGTSALHFHLTAPTLVIGLFSSVVVSAVTIWLVLRKQARRPARELLAGGGGEERPQAATFRSLWVAIASSVLALGMIAWALAKNATADAETFFGAGSLFLIAGLGFSAALFGALNRSATTSRMTVGSLGLKGCTRRHKRSLATVGLLACGSFLIAAIGAFKLDADADASKRSSGTGGFSLIGESTLPVVQDLNTRAGREFFGLDAKALGGVDVLPLRVHDGDDASCLNLNRAQIPRLLGVNPQLLHAKNAFTFAKLASDLSAQNPWLRLEEKADDGAVPAVGDLNSILWAMGKKVGDTLNLVDEHGQPFKIRLVGGLANSILQGSLLISEREFLERFPGEAGYRMYLIDAPSNEVTAVSTTLTRALQDAGLELTPASRRLAAFNAVQNTYLNTFQVLGGLGLLLGSAGLGVVVLRNVLERRGELALLQAVGFRRRTLQWLVLSEHGGLLALGLGVGIVAALVAILPVLLAPGAEVHYLSMLATLVTVFTSGLAFTWLATWLALRGELLKALRNE